MAMNVFEAVERRQIKERRITCRGFARTDGLWDIEGHLVDTSTEPIDLPVGQVAPGAPLHEMRIRVTIDIDMNIVDLEAKTLHGPYPVCGLINEAYRSLIGVRIQAGYNQLVKGRFRNELGCTHLTELLPPMATAAFQLLLPVWGRMGRPTNVVGGCHAMRVDGDVVRLYFPDQFRPDYRVAR